mmetsp:Transcript_7488/g.15510  ORF Transcript_7488/g.15510 Transcript_7488/m.15510 type:complete len:229 (+) Transcript_7488:1164-1850(+)
MSCSMPKTCASDGPRVPVTTLNWSEKTDTPPQWIRLPSPIPKYKKKIRRKNSTKTKRRNTTNKTPKTRLNRTMKILMNTKRAVGTWIAGATRKSNSPWRIFWTIPLLPELDLRSCSFWESCASSSAVFRPPRSDEKRRATATRKSNSGHAQEHTGIILATKNRVTIAILTMLMGATMMRTVLMVKKNMANTKVYRFLLVLLFVPHPLFPRDYCNENVHYTIHCTIYKL